MDPEKGKTRDDLMLDYLMGMGALQPEADKVAQQQSLVNLLRQGGMQAPQMRQAGRFQVAASPLEFLGQVANAAGGAYTGQQAQAAQEEYKRKRLELLGSLRNQQAAIQPPAAPTTNPSPTMAP